MNNKSFSFVSPPRPVVGRPAPILKTIPQIICQFLVTLSKFTSPFPHPPFLIYFCRRKGLTRINFWQIPSNFAVDLCWLVSFASGAEKIRKYSWNIRQNPSTVSDNFLVWNSHFLKKARGSRVPLILTLLLHQVLFQYKKRSLFSLASDKWIFKKCCRWHLFICMFWIPVRVFE